MPAAGAGGELDRLADQQVSGDNPHRIPGMLGIGEAAPAGQGLIAVERRDGGFSAAHEVLVHHVIVDQQCAVQQLEGAGQVDGAGLIAAREGAVAEHGQGRAHQLAGSQAAGDLRPQHSALGGIGRSALLRLRADLRKPLADGGLGGLVDESVFAAHHARAGRRGLIGAGVRCHSSLLRESGGVE
ncbi:hypothetical protein AAHB37_07725 [Glutamicibacter halophytocola]